MGLLSFLQGLVTGGNATGWTAFGQSNADKGVPAAGIEKGQDIGLRLGTPIPAEPGIVTAVAPWGYGDYAVTEQLDSGGLLTVGHITPQVSVGQKLTATSQIGTSRGLPSPISTKPHIEVRYQTAPGNAFIDPLPILKSGDTSTTFQWKGSGNPSSIPVVGGLLGLLPNIFGDIVRILLAILAIISLFIGLYILFKPEDAPGIADVVKLAPLAAA